ncbi:MAG: LLM class F420-dependent oxidoreductase [Dehalococcoidia bacterium]
MKFGVVFPQTEIGADPGPVREFAQAAEDLGYSGLVVYDHVLGADPRSRPGWEGFYKLEDMFHEPFVLFGYLASITERIQLVTGVIILAQRQTVLVAKQAAEVDVLSGGRLCLGIGIGWNDIEFEALGEDFHDRGKRSEEQIEVLRALWTKEVVDFKGRWHRIPSAGLNPLPVQRPIPIWVGGDAEPVLKRTGRMGDGWMPLDKPHERTKAAVERVRNYAREAGRDPSSIAIAAVMHLSVSNFDELLAEAREWQSIGASHLYLDTMRSGLDSVKNHVETISKFKEALDGLS